MLRTILFLLATLVALPVIAWYYDAPPGPEHWAAVKTLFQVMLAAALLCFAVSELTRNYSQVDKLWSLLPIGYAWYVAIGIGFAVGLGLPRWLLGFTINRRKKAFSKEFANAIDVIVRGVKAGLPLNECLKIIANETAEPVGPEFRQIVEGLKVGVTLEDGLKRMYDRMPIAEVNFFQIVLTIQQKTGGNLSEALGNLSSVLRDRKRLHGKIQALSSEAKASAGIIGSLPMVVMGLVYFTTPEYIALLFTERFGNFLLLCCAGWMSVGIFVMKKMIDFKY